MTLSNQRNQIPTDPDFSTLRKMDILYAYLQTISKWKGKKKGSPRYIEKKDLSPTKIGRELGKSSRTIYRQLNKLKDKGYIREENDLIYLDIPSVYTTVNPKTLVTLYQTSTDDVINVYVFMRWVYLAAEKKGRPAIFLKSYVLSEVLGISSSGQSYQRLDNIINDIALKGLVELEMRTRFTPQGNRFQEYRIINFYDKVAKAPIEIVEATLPSPETMVEITERLNQERMEYKF